MSSPRIGPRSSRSRRSLQLVSLALVAVLAVFFLTQVIHGDRYRTISDASRAAHTGNR
jgi:hypothetical protein